MLHDTHSSRIPHNRKGVPSSWQMDFCLSSADGGAEDYKLFDDNLIGEGDVQSQHVEAASALTVQELTLNIDSLASLSDHIIYELCEGGGLYHCRILDVVYDARAILSDASLWKGCRRGGKQCKQLMLAAISEAHRQHYQQQHKSTLQAVCVVCDVTSSGTPQKEGVATRSRD